MISQYTWPNFHGGTEKEGTKILVEEQGFTNDVKYGNTKIFIRSPQTLFALEQVRLTTPQIIQFSQQKCLKLIFMIGVMNCDVFLCIDYIHHNCRNYRDEPNSYPGL